MAPIPVAAASGAELNKAVAAARTSTAARLPAGVAAELTGVPAFGADIGNAMSNANITLLVVTASVVAVLLVVTYRSPILWLVPLAVIGFADGLSTAVGTVVSRVTGLTFDGATAGITSVLVFGAGTNYALLLISRYREELSGADDHRAALRTAVSRAGPAVIASNATVVLALATLVFAAAPATGSLGVHAACGLVIAVLSRTARDAAAAEPVRHTAVLAVHSPSRRTHGGHRRRVAQDCDMGDPACGRVAATSIVVLGAMAVGLLGYADRPVADRTVPGEGRIGERLRNAVRPLPQRHDRSHHRDR